jgi:hypothetical protein
MNVVAIVIVIFAIVWIVIVAVVCNFIIDKYRREVSRLFVLSITNLNEKLNLYFSVESCGFVWYN